MTAYQVYSGKTNKHGFQTYDLIATFLSKEKAEGLALGIVAGTPLYGDILEDTGWTNGYRGFYARGWEHVGICKITEITITE